MAKADRLERLDVRRAELESEYLEVLTGALQRAAAGSWGLFAHTKDRSSAAKWAPIVEQLCDMGQEIGEMRAGLGMGPFELHQEFEESRGPVSSSAPGEPKQAKAWLERLGKPA
jgi:hypothetical protein